MMPTEPDFRERALAASLKLAEQPLHVLQFVISASARSRPH